MANSDYEDDTGAERTEPSSANFKAMAAKLEPDAHGQAALLLAEATLHTLVENGILTNEDAVGIVETAKEVKVEVAEAAHESKKRMEQSLRLLDGIAVTFHSNQQ